VGGKDAKEAIPVAEEMRSYQSCSPLDFLATPFWAMPKRFSAFLQPNYSYAYMSPVKSKVIAKNNRASFIGTQPDGSFCVFTLDDTTDIDLGDVLGGCFDDTDGLFKWVHNDTQDERVYICAENWECSREIAFKFLKRLGKPTKIWTL